MLKNSKKLNEAFNVLLGARCDHGGRENSCRLCFKDRVAARMKGTTVDQIQRQRQARISSFVKRRKTDRGYYPPFVKTKKDQEKFDRERLGDLT